MYIIKNSIKNILRNKGRNLMIGIIMLAIIISSVISLMINNTADGVINDYKERFGSEAVLTPNMQKLQEEAMKNSTDGRVKISRPQIAAEDLIKYSESDYLKSTVFTATTNGNSKQLEAIDKDKGPGGGRMTMGSGPNGKTSDNSSSRQYYHKLMANYYDEFTDGSRKLDEGHMPEAKNECIISKDLLENSNLKVGDIITVTSTLMKIEEDNSIKYTDISWELTIVGTFLDATDEYQNNMMQNAHSNRRNEILTTFETLSEKIVEGKTGISVDAKFYLADPSALEDFETEARAKGLSEIFDVTTDTNSYNKVIGPVEGLKGISVSFVIVVLIFGGIIITLLSLIAVRERKYEIGVLRAMGMKKGKVVVGLWTEMLVITIVCLIVGLSVGVLVAQPVTNMMLEKQIVAADEATNTNAEGPAFSSGHNGPARGGMQMGGMMIGTPESNAMPLENLDVSINFITILQLCVISLLLSSVAGITAASQITKYEPIKILMERN